MKKFGIKIGAIIFFCIALIICDKENSKSKTEAYTLESINYNESKNNFYDLSYYHMSEDEDANPEQNYTLDNINGMSYSEAANRNNYGELPVYVEQNNVYYPLDTCRYDVSSDLIYTGEYGDYLFENEEDIEDKEQVLFIRDEYNEHIQNVNTNDRIIIFNKGEIYNIYLEKIEPDNFRYVSEGFFRFTDDDGKIKYGFPKNKYFVDWNLDSTGIFEYHDIYEIDGKPINDFTNYKQYLYVDMDELFGGYTTHKTYLFDYDKPTTVDVKYYDNYEETHKKIDVKDIAFVSRNEVIDIDYSEADEGYKYFDFPDLEPGMYRLYIKRSTSVDYNMRFIINVNSNNNNYIEDVNNISNEEINQEVEITYSDNENDSIKNTNVDIKLRSGTVNVDLNEDMFKSDNTKYNYDIAKLAVTLSEAAYDDRGEVKEGKYISNAYKSLGFNDEDISLYSYPDSQYNISSYIFDDENLAFSIASKKLDDKTLLVIDFRGSVTLGDWSKDLFGGLSNKIFFNTEAWGGFYDYWNDYDIAITEYYESHPNIQKADEEGKLVVLVTGHSLGAAAANLTGKSLNDGYGVFKNLTCKNIYVYTFACPLVCKEITIDKNIFNIVNFYDVVPKVPTEYKRYGRIFRFKNYNISILKNHACKTYLDAVINDELLEEVTQQEELKFSYANIWCPVDVQIKKNGEIVGEIIDNEITVCEENLCMEVEDDHKFIVLPEDEEYTINIKATNDGQMSFYIMGYDGSNEYIKTYSDIDIKEGDSFVAEISNPENPNNTELKYESNKKLITIPEDTEDKTSGEKFVEVKDNTEKLYIKYVIICLSAIFLAFIIILIVVLRRRKRIIKENATQNNLRFDNIVYCSECGTELKIVQRFCHICGAENKFFNN